MAAMKMTGTSRWTSEETEQEACTMEQDAEEKDGPDAFGCEAEAPDGFADEEFGEGGFPGDEVVHYGGEGNGEPASALDSRELGRRGEDAAVRYLEFNGYDILERNWRCRFGEVDIIALDDDRVLCFIEVKTRRNIASGIPEEAVTPAKQRRYERIALCYLVDSNWEEETAVRFDAIGICVTGEHKALLRHHKGCFDGLF